VVFVAFDFAEVEAGDESVRSLVLLTRGSFTTLPHEFVCLLVGLEDSCLTRVNFESIFDLIQLQLELLDDSVLLELRRLLPRQLFLHLLILVLQLSLNFKPFLHLCKLFLKLECLSVALGLPLVVHQKAQALRVKLICLVHD